MDQNNPPTWRTHQALLFCQYSHLAGQYISSSPSGQSGTWLHVCHSGNSSPLAQINTPLSMSTTSSVKYNRTPTIRPTMKSQLLLTMKAHLTIFVLVSALSYTWCPLCMYLRIVLFYLKHRLAKLLVDRSKAINKLFINRGPEFAVTTRMQGMKPFFISWFPDDCKNTLFGIFTIPLGKIWLLHVVKINSFSISKAPWQSGKMRSYIKNFKRVWLSSSSFPPIYSKGSQKQHS